MIIVDSSVWIDYFNGLETKQTNILDHILEFKRVGIIDIIYLEVLQGFLIEKHFNIARGLLDSISYFETKDKDFYLLCIQNYRYLRKKGVTIRKTIDVIIASYCIANQLTLLHNDKDFLPFQKHLGLIESI